MRACAWQTSKYSVCVAARNNFCHSSCLSVGQRQAVSFRSCHFARLILVKALVALSRAAQFSLGVLVLAVGKKKEKGFMVEMAAYVQVMFKQISSNQKATETVRQTMSVNVLCCAMEEHLIAADTHGTFVDQFHRSSP